MSLVEILAPPITAANGFVVMVWWGAVGCDRVWRGEVLWCSVVWFGVR